MRDPDGAITFHAELAIRHIRPNATAEPFLKSASGRDLVTAGKLIPYEFREANTIVSPRLPFVSYPFEWCDVQLHLAAQLTLDVSRDALAAGHELKDASAWNVIFRGNQPLFCDHLSFQPVITREWWAFGQFARQFLLPVAVSRARGLKPHQCFSIFRDGLPPDVARRILGLKRYLTRYWPLMAGDGSSTTPGNVAGTSGPRLHEGLYELCQSMLNGGASSRGKMGWSDYTKTRRHYSDEASDSKLQKVGEWLAMVTPTWVVDLGCNTGEFTALCADTGADVIAVDLDHDCIQELVLSQKNSAKIHPVIANLGDMVGGRGWCGDEFSSLMVRLHKRCDLLLMLALTHHLAISESVPLTRIAEMAASITTAFLILEILDSTDAMVLQLCSQRKRNAEDFSFSAQVAAFEPYFTTLEVYPMPNMSRSLCLLKLR